MKPNGKCIARKCEDCNLFYDWHMTNNEGIGKMEKKCVFLVLAEEIPRIRGSIDGVQEAANESRNRAEETKERIEDLGAATMLSLKHMDKKLLENK
jgi:hypothetical protein